MKRIFVICEGETEQNFAQYLLSPYFFSLSIYLIPVLIQKTRGGIVSWDALKTQIVNHLRETGVFATTFIDYYGIPDNFQYPRWEEAKGIVDANRRMDFLEAAMKKDLPDSLQYRFIPYLQLHEFEGLLFNNIEAFDSQLEEDEFNRDQIIQILRNYPNPELINNNPRTTPSKRLKELIPDYQKVVYGQYIAEAIGLQKIRAKCPRFNAWIEHLETM